MASTSTSTYLLDTSKKCKITGTGDFTDDNNFYWSWYGDLDVKCLQNLGASFTENWKSGTEYAEKAVEQTLKPVTVAMNAVAKQIPMLKNVNFEKNEDSLRNSAIFLYALWKSFAKGTKSTDTAADFLENFCTAYRYNIPYRADIPALEPLGGSKITIHFAYGKCNMFSAKKEVWEPLKHLEAAIFPNLSASNTGLVKVTGNTVPVPLPQQIGIKAINTILSKAFSVGKSSTKAFDTIEVFADTATNLQSLGEGSIKIEKLADEESGWSRFWKGEASDKYFEYDKGRLENLQNAAKKVYNDGSAKLDDVKTVKSYNSGEPFNYNAEAELVLEALKEAAEVNAMSQDTPHTVELPKKAFPVKNAIDKGVDAITEKHQMKLKPSNGNQPYSIPAVLKGLIQFVPERVGEITSDFYTDLSKYATTIEFGYPSVRKTNKEDLGTVLSKLGARVKLQEILLQKVNITFDFEHTDEYGYPMAGKLEIEKIWNLKYPGETLTLSGTDQANLNTPALDY